MNDPLTPVTGLSDFIALMGPSRPVLVTSRFRDGSVNVAPFSWCTPVSENPPMLALVLLTKPRRQRTLINILREREFVVNVPGPELADRMVQASFWYPRGVNKLEQLKFATAPARFVAAPVLTECRAQIECKLFQVIPTGDHTTLIAEVLAAAFDTSVFGPGYLLDMGKTSPLLHLRHFNTSDGQVHVFYTGSQSRTANLPFPVGGMDAMGRPTGDDED